MFMVYCILKFIIEQLILVFKRKAILISAFKTGDYEKNKGPIGHKIIEELPAPIKQLLNPDVLSEGRSPKDYKDREFNENEQAPINIKQKSPPPTLPKILP